MVFTAYSPLSSNAELARRLLSPMTAAQIPGILARTGKALAPQSVDLARERFVLFTPGTEPPGGYGLLVFVSPSPRAVLPEGWAEVLDREGVIFVSADGSGNDASVLGRREPLAILAEQNVARRFPLNSRRIWIGGYSGGSRVAMRLALAYPDVFSGAILNDGSDPIGEGEVPLPPRDLFHRFQEGTRLVYITGARDVVHLAEDAASQQSMARWCVFGVESETMAFAGHALPGDGALLGAIRTLDHPRPINAARLASCRTKIAKEQAARLSKIENLMAAGKNSEARKELEEVDRSFGGLAAPQSLELAAKLNTG
ncbi:MAG: hypothetical protein ACRED9_07365 [Caulobacteraceae bacterium]